MPGLPEFRVPRRSPPEVVLHAYQPGRVAADDFEHLQRRLAYESAARNDGLITLLLAEHPPLISMGRGGSRQEILCDDESLAAWQVEIEPVARGGGCVPHGPGQLAIGLVTPLARLQWSVGQYLQRLHAGLAGAIEGLGIRPRRRTDRFGLWGRSGQLVACGVAVRHGVAMFGAWLNVSPLLPLAARVITSPGDTQPHMGSLVAEKASAGRIEMVRELLPRHLAATLADGQCELFAEHPLLPSPEKHVARLIA